MFKYVNKASSEANIEKLWLNYQDVKNWFKWDSSIENAELNGDFIEGTKGILKNIGMPPLDFELTEVKEKISFSNKSQIGPFSVMFTHIITVDNKFITIEHGVIVNGPDENKVNEIGNGISSTIPNAMSKILEVSK